MCIFPEAIAHRVDVPEFYVCRAMGLLENSLCLSRSLQLFSIADRELFRAGDGVIDSGPVGRTGHEAGHHPSSGG